jgi:hypothetical protein
MTYEERKYLAIGAVIGALAQWLMMTIFGGC